MAAQAVYRAKAGTNRGLDVTFGYDNSPNSTSQQNSMITVGAVYHGVIPPRTVDQLSFGLSPHARVTPQARLTNSSSDIRSGGKRRTRSTTAPRLGPIW